MQSIITICIILNIFKYDVYYSYNELINFIIFVKLSNFNRDYFYNKALINNTMKQLRYLSNFM